MLKIKNMMIFSNCKNNYGSMIQWKRISNAKKELKLLMSTYFFGGLVVTLFHPRGPLLEMWLRKF